jgi:hypothetical protein
MGADKSAGQELGEQDAFEIQATSLAEIDQIAERLPGNAQIIDELRLVLRQQLADGFEFHHNAAKNHQVGNVSFLQFVAFVMTGQLGLGAERNVTKP